MLNSVTKVIKRESNLLRQKCMEGALITRSFTVNLHLGSYISPFLADFLLSECGILNKTDENIKKMKLNEIV